MKKSRLSRLLNDARSDPDWIDHGADDLAHELSGYPVNYFDPDNDADATKEEMQKACISLVKALEMHGQPPSSHVIEMLEWAIGLRQRKQGNPGKPWERDDAIFEEAAWLYRGWEPRPEGTMPVLKLARAVGVNRETVRRWRRDPNYLREISEMILEDYETSME